MQTSTAIRSSPSLGFEREFARGAPLTDYTEKGFVECGLHFLDPTQDAVFRIEPSFRFDPQGFGVFSRHETVNILPIGWDLRGQRSPVGPGTADSDQRMTYGEERENEKDVSHSKHMVQRARQSHSSKWCISLRGIDTLTAAVGRKLPDLGSGCEATLPPDGKRLGSKRFEDAAWQEMALDVEGVLDGGVDCQETLG